MPGIVQNPLNLIAGGRVLLLFSTFYKKETETQREYTTCPKSVVKWLSGGARVQSQGLMTPESLLLTTMIPA